MPNNTSTYVIGGGSGPNIEEVLPDVGGGGGELPTGYSIYYHINGYGTQPGTRYYQTALPNPLPTLTANGVIFEGWYTDSNLSAKAVAGAAISADAHLYAKWRTPAALGSFNIQKGALPTWHDLYIKDSQELVDLNDIAVPITESDVNTYGYNVSSDYYKTTSWLCTDNNIVGKNVPTIPKYLINNQSSLVFKGCSMDVGITNWTGSIATKTFYNSGTLTRTTEGKLIYTTDKDNKTTILTDSAPYLVYFELVGGGGGGASNSDENYLIAGGGGGAGSAIAGVFNFTVSKSYQIQIGTGGLGGGRNYDTDKTVRYHQPGKNGQDSYIIASSYPGVFYVVPGGRGGNCGYYNNNTYALVPGTGGTGGVPCYYIYDTDYNNGNMDYKTTLTARYYAYPGIFVLHTVRGNTGGTATVNADGAYLYGGVGGSIEGETNVSFFGTKTNTILPNITTGLGGEFNNKGSCGGGMNGMDDAYGYSGMHGGGGGGGAANGGNGGSGHLVLRWSCI